MSFLQSLSKTGASNSNSATQNDNAKVWADRLVPSASSSSSSGLQQNTFRSTPSNIESLEEYESFISPTTEPGKLEAVGPYSLLNDTFSPDIEFQKSIDGLDVVGLLEVMDTQETELEALMAGRGGEKAMPVEEEVEDPVEWLGLTRGEYTDEVWGDSEKMEKGKGKEIIKEEVKEEVLVKGKGKGKGVYMKGRL
ncbi:hypothetical protein TWF106_008497 [Orbilia oligospora]|uniref:Uncharacterized protein n=1 Tax=Orbilia oligospora TaxID=2813651 RepID=A0A6G1MHZ8_ORBOL|nr:hypothetical protein TWF788_004237 [Orbilia oligospora]KAF3216322.1 hypothetical protein TWF106_008497 [Orbilia oligospora]KAF3220316.1 hypothetical protein TWF679_009691 [Orbilia oligospora]KAF3227458.1 hypothetical protein TWF191_003543 [Orbilia oligospora]KAF3258996.1 hypothetical protein TWF192_011129 [Orbilia oligospora]